MDLNVVKAESQNLKKIQSSLLKWEIKENPLAPLDSSQNEILYKITQLLAADSGKESSPDPLPKNDTDHSVSSSGISITPLCIESTQEFLSWYNQVDDKINMEQFDDVYLEYYQQLEERTKECDKILNEIDVSLDSLNLLTTQYNFVSNKTASLHLASENLIQEQKQLLDISDDIRARLKNFMQVEQISQRLQNPTFSPASEQFVEILNTIDECLEYMRVHPKFKEASPYSIKYKQCLLKAVQMIRNYVTNILTIATDQVLTPKVNSNKEPLKITDKSSEAVFALYYGKFQASSVKIKKVTELVEQRYQKNAEYESLLYELHQQYLQQRALIMSSGVDNAIRDLCGKHKGDHCTLVRGSCAFLVHICQDEHRLFYQFFSLKSSQLITYMEGLCTILYDTLRPFIIHINHLETLAEICSIMRTEMLEEHVLNNQEALEAFGKIVNQLLQDAQERLVFRAHLYLQSDILNYNPSPGDLAYPGKLEMMESIALSLQENQPLRRADSRSSMFSTTSVDVVEQHFRARTGNSPADLHGMWYPTVRRTLVCLSRLYRCVDRPIFQGLSQEALAFCIQNVSSAANSISSQKSTIDGELFEIKHLLILREQIAPFRVDFTVKETSLDFSKMKTAAFDLLQKRKQLFSMGSNNALLEFLLEGAPQVKENLLDSRKDVDRQLKSICEVFIRDATKQLVGPILGFLEQAQNLLKQPQQAKGVAASLVLRQTSWAAPQQISSLIQESKRNIKSKLAGIQRSMQLYLSNKDTEFILFKPIRNNIISAIVKLEQLLTSNDYSKDDLTIVSCPTADHISILISSASLTADAVQQQENRKTSFSGDNFRKISTSSMVEKKVSFDKGITEGREEEIIEKEVKVVKEVIIEPEAQITDTEDKTTAL